MNKRSTKFYRKNEAEVMESLGMKATKNSGSGWIEKEDGQNDQLICQLKSTDAQSIKVNQKDIRILEYNASVANKVPLFAIQFLNTNEVWLMIKPEDVFNVAEALNGAVIKKQDSLFNVDESTLYKAPRNVRKAIKSSSNARERFHEEKNKKYDKTRSAT